MKKLIIASLLMLMTSFVYADKPTSYTRVSTPVINMRFNMETQVKEGEGEATTMVTKYIPITVVVTGEAYTDDNGTRDVIMYATFGALSDTPKTKKEIYNIVPTQLRDILKDWYLEAINEDVTQ